jgi:hypothetical protein
MATDKLGLIGGEADNWKPRALLIGALIGAAVGVGAAYLFVQQAEREGSTPSISAGEGVKLGLLVLGLLRSVAVLGEGDK